MDKKTTWRQAFGLSALDYKIPIHANSFWYSLGGITLICLIITIVTGAILTQFYDPNPNTAHSSIRYISETPVLALFRSLHHWSANIVFALIILHVLRVLYTGSFRPPRTINYFIGIALMSIVFMMFFSGTVVKWDQEGYEALEHFQATGALMGPLGAFFQEDFTLSNTMLARIYGLHIGILPVLLISTLALHAMYIRHFGISPKPYQTPDEYEQSKADGHTFKTHLKKLIGYAMILISILTLLAYLFPPQLLNSPVMGHEVTKPPWPFWIFYPLEGLLGIKALILASGVFILVLILIPVINFKIKNQQKGLLVTRIIVTVAVIIWISQLIITYLLPPMKHLGH